jgi:hypothetical protein
VNKQKQKELKRQNKEKENCFANLKDEKTDGAVMVCEINEVNDRPVGKPQEQSMMNIAASFSLSKKPRFNHPGGGRNTTEGDAH